MNKRTEIDIPQIPQNIDEICIGLTACTPEELKQYNQMVHRGQKRKLALIIEKKFYAVKNREEKTKAIKDAQETCIIARQRMESSQKIYLQMSAALRTLVKSYEDVVHAVE